MQRAIRKLYRDPRLSPQLLCNYEPEILAVKRMEGMHYSNLLLTIVIDCI